ncbi:sel1 repeat family protein, partial [Escherichia coli]|nr:sel1 repeat family protein [Escherichia coli]
YYTYVYFNIPKQIKYLARAASQGNITAQYNYAMILSSEEDDSYLKYYILDNAINWLKMAASHGYIKAEVELLRLERLKETMRLGKDHPMP